MRPREGFWMYEKLASHQIRFPLKFYIYEIFYISTNLICRVCPRERFLTPPPRPINFVHDLSKYIVIYFLFFGG